MDNSLLRTLAAVSAIILVAAAPGGTADGADSLQSLSLVCLTSTPAAFNSMETSAAPASCWYHIGHHHYFVSQNTTYELWGGSGLVFVVEEVVFSPTTEGLNATTGNTTGLVTAIPIEISMDGLSWQRVADAEFRVVAVESSTDPLDVLPETLCDNSGACEYREGTDALNCIGTPGGCHDTYWRQLVQVDFTANGEEFRYFRVALPPSIYTGLSGFLDGSNLQIHVTPGNAVVDPALVARTGVALDCTQDILEDILPGSPCTFGGYVLQDTTVGPVTHVVGNHPGQWDSPSFFHTYPIQNGTLDRISGEVLVRDWRNNAVPAARAIRVQTSTDGEAWQTVHTFSVNQVPPQPIGVVNVAVPDYAGTFDVNLTDQPARFVRLVAETMPSWSTTASNKHPWAFFLDSEIALSGDLPATL